MTRSWGPGPRHQECHRRGTLPPTTFWGSRVWQCSTVVAQPRAWSARYCRSPDQSLSTISPVVGSRTFFFAGSRPSSIFRRLRSSLSVRPDVLAACPMHISLKYLPVSSTSPKRTASPGINITCLILRQPLPLRTYEPFVLARSIT